MLIQLSNLQISECLDFAKKCVETNKYYASRGQSNIDKIVNDIYVGKLGEWAVYEFLKSKYKDVTPPDMIITNKKTHGADLVADTIMFDVKTQTLDSVRRYGMSWLMEKSSLNKFYGHYVVMCMQISPQEVIIQNIVAFEELLSVQSEPKLSYLKTKAAFYYSDILFKKITSNPS
jgi:hypothetical protein